MLISIMIIFSKDGGFWITNFVGLEKIRIGRSIHNDSHLDTMPQLFSNNHYLDPNAFCN